MLPRNKRIGSRMFKEIIAKGRVVHSLNFFMRISKKNPDYSGFSVVASKKVAPTAVTRNRLRRRVYAALRKVVSNKKTEGEALIFVKHSLSSLASKDMEKELHSLLKDGNAILE
jgi:ribonuclease P protein component